MQTNLLEERKLMKAPRVEAERLHLLSRVTPMQTNLLEQRELVEASRAEAKGLAAAHLTEHVLLARGLDVPRQEHHHVPEHGHLHQLPPKGEAPKRDTEETIKERPKRQLERC